MRLYDLNESKLYIDSAFLYQKDIKETSLFGHLYNTCAVYYSLILNDSASHLNYYRAIEFYEKAGMTNELISIYHNLAFSYIQKNDTETLKKIIEKMRLLALAQNKHEDIIDTYRIIAFYYSNLYKKNQQSINLDSAIYYDKQAISIFESKSSQITRPNEIAYNYINLASNLLENGCFHPDTIIDVLAKAEKMSNPNDTVMMINLYWVKGLIAYNNDEYVKAEQLFSDQLSLMEHWSINNPLLAYTSLYQKLSEIFEKKENYLQALEYERKRNDYLRQIHDTQKYETVRELETKYEVRQKEQEISRLTEMNAYQKKINILYLSVSVLFIIASFITVNWFRLKKKMVETQLALTYSEKNEANLKIKLKEDQLEKTKLEKYEALLDSHFKKEQIVEMDNELKSLKNEQQQLNILIDKYTVRLKEYEKKKSFETVFSTSDIINTNILNDIYLLINKRFKNDSKHTEYIERLSMIDDTFFYRLKKRDKGNVLSVLDIKRCITFLIGMETFQVAEFFSVEPTSIHQTRHRLKCKLNIEKEMDLDMFLKQLLFERE